MGEKQKKSKKVGKGFAIFLIILLTIIVILFIFVLINRFSVLEKKEIYAGVIVGDHAGFDLNKTALTFGMVKPGNSGSRGLMIGNDYGKKEKIVITSRGDISDFLIVSENDFVLDIGEKKQVEFSVFIPKDIELGKYDGEIIITARRF